MRSDRKKECHIFIGLTVSLPLTRSKVSQKKKEKRKSALGCHFVCLVVVRELCLCVCVRARARVCVCVHAYVRACVRACMRVFVRACVFNFVCVWISFLHDVLFSLL